MERGTDTLEKPKVHHGRNVKRARNLSCKTQEDLAELLGSNQKAVYHLEQQEVIEEPTLVQIANVLHFPVEFFKQVQPDDMLQKYTIENNTQTVGDNSLDSFNLNGSLNGSSNNTFTITGDSKYVKLCEDLSKVHEKVIEIVTKELNSETAKNKKLASELARVQKELEKLKSDKN